MAAIVFSLEQRDALEALTLDGSANFYAGYDYLRQELEALTPVDMTAMQVTQAQVDGCIFWLTRASSINQNVLSDAANNFIRDITRYGLLWDDRPVGRIQFNSDAIGTAVIGEILNTREFPDIGVIVGKDVQAAITLGGQTIGGWGGAFYYWDAPYAAGGPGVTVGAAIEDDPTQLEKFISLASAATFNALARTFEDPFNLTNAGELVADIVEMLLTGASAAVPLSITWEIGDRVTDYITGTRQHFSDNPLFWDWEKSIDLSNAVGTIAAGQNGFEINLITGQISGLGHSREDFETFFRVENVKGSNLGDRITLDGTTTYVEVQAGTGDDKLFATGGTVVADGGGGYDTFVVNASFADVTILRTLDRLTFSGVSSPFTYLLADFDIVQFLDQAKSFLDLLASTVQEFTGSGDLIGTQWNDKLVGGAGRTVIAGLSGADQISDPDWLVLDYSASDAGITLNRTSTQRSFTLSGGHAQGDTVLLGSTSARLDVIGSNFGDTVGAFYRFDGGDGDDVITNVSYVRAGGGYDIVHADSSTTYVDFEEGGGELFLPKNSGSFFIDMEQGIYRRTNNAGEHYLTVLGEFDKITGSQQNDVIHGTSGNDRIYGGGGFDTIYGGDGEDYIEAYGNLHGGDKKDVIKLLGTNANWQHSVWGDDGNDELTSSARLSTLYGGIGDDRLTSTTYQVKMVGGEGADTFVGTSAQNAWNWISYEDATSGIGVTYDAYTGTGWLGDAAGDVMTGNFSFHGSSYQDTFNVTLRSGYGVELRGGAGSDIMNVHFIGGSTTVYGDGLTDVEGASYDDVITTTGHNSGVVRGGRGDDTITGVGVLHGDEGADTLKGTASTQTFYLGVDDDADTFIYSGLGNQRHTVFDFTDLDLIRIEGGPHDSFADIIDNAVQSGNDVHISFLNSYGKIILGGVQLSNLMDSNFEFV